MMSAQELRDWTRDSQVRSGCIPKLARLAISIAILIASVAWLTDSPAHTTRVASVAPAAILPTSLAPIPTTTMLEAAASKARSTKRVVPVAPEQPALPVQHAEPRISSRVSEDVWDDLSICESSDTNAETGNGFWGYFQFDDSTWLGISHLPGHASDYPRTIQLEFAKVLQAQRGWSPWPACSRKLGLR